MCAFACTQKTPNLRRWFLQRRLTNTPRSHRLADGQLSSLYGPSPSFSSFGATSVMFCCSAPPACSSTPLRPSVRYPSIGLVISIMYIQTFCENLNVLGLVSCWSQAGVQRRESPPDRQSSFPVVSPPDATAKPMASSHHFTPPCQVQLVRRRLCKALRSSSLVRNIRICCLVQQSEMSEI